MTTPLFLLRCLQIGLSLDELDLLTIGMVTEIAIERANDEYDYPILATQELYDVNAVREKSSVVVMEDNIINM